MERALKSFLDGVSEDDNVVNLETEVESDVKNDEVSGEDSGEDSGVIARGNGSGMLDMRAMAQRYQEMSNATFDKPVERAAPEVPLAAHIVREHLLAPVVEQPEEETNRGLLMVGVAAAVLVTIVCTAAITATFVRRSVMAEIAEMGLVSQPVASVTQNPASAIPQDENSAGQPGALAAWPETDPTLAPAADEDEDEDKDTHLEMNFHESEVGKLPKPRFRDKDPGAVTTSPTPIPVPTAVTPPPNPEETTPELTPETTPEPKPTTSADGEPCDEVLCLVDGRGCCGTTKKKVPDAVEVDTSLPERLARDDIKKGLAKIDGRLNSCGSRFEISGVVTLKLKINAEGKIQSSGVSTGSEEFKTCIYKTLQKARFLRTQQGASLSYPVILR